MKIAEPENSNISGIPSRLSATDSDFQLIVLFGMTQMVMGGLIQGMVLELLTL